MYNLERDCDIENNENGTVSHIIAKSGFVLLKHKKVEALSSANILFDAFNIPIFKREKMTDWNVACHHGIDLCLSSH